MKKIVSVIALLVVGVIGCDGLRIESKPEQPTVRRTKCPFTNYPPAHISFAFRQANYHGGSCNHASMITVLRHHGLHEWAVRWRRNRAGGIDCTGLARLAERDGLRFAYTCNGDAKFLDWCSRTRRPAAIHYYSNHAITFCGYVKGKAVLIDNNDTRRLIRIPKARFVRNWKHYGGRAIAVLYAPPTPKPWL